MAVGLQCRDPQGRIIFDTTTMTSRLLGSRSAAVGHLEVVNVPVSAGKRLWYRAQIRGNVSCYLYQAGPANQFTIQVEGPAFGVANGSAQVWWGEY